MDDIEKLKKCIREKRESLRMGDSQLIEMERELDRISNPWLVDGSFTREELAILPNGEVISGW